MLGCTCSIIIFFGGILLNDDNYSLRWRTHILSGILNTERWMQIQEHCIHSNANTRFETNTKYSYSMIAFKKSNVMSVQFYFNPMLLGVKPKNLKMCYLSSLTVYYSDVSGNLKIQVLLFTFAYQKNFEKHYSETAQNILLLWIKKSDNCSNT